jgi:hypothetical protein
MMLFQIDDGMISRISTSDKANAQSPTYVNHSIVGKKIEKIIVVASV